MGGVSSGLEEEEIIGKCVHSFNIDRTIYIRIENIRKKLNSYLKYTS
ncbi:hypothetical protein GCM10010978_26120 [Compostibacillus humi]|uniref:Uncharacterized protein n=1 Tax=Compostibacillus humi TaxID=1245525 RepID=A0A8J2TRM2_9BACI|nr:hypothetical protein GCM10010978_26120 [Compostibacillus humi]